MSGHFIAAFHLIWHLCYFHELFYLLCHYFSSFFLFLFFLNMPVGARENNTGLLQDSDATAGKKYFLLPRIRTFVHFNNLFPSAFYYIFYLWIHYSLVSSIFSYLYAFLLNPFRFFPKMCMTQVGVIPPPLPLHLPLCKAPLLKSCVF